MTCYQEDVGVIKGYTTYTYGQDTVLDKCAKVLDRNSLISERIRERVRRWLRASTGSVYRGLLTIGTYLLKDKTWWGGWRHPIKEFYRSKSPSFLSIWMPALHKWHLIGRITVKWWQNSSNPSISIINTLKKSYFVCSITNKWGKFYHNYFILKE